MKGERIKKKVKIENEEQVNQESVQTEQAVWVDFWATRCNFLRRISPVIDRIENKYGKDGKIAKLNVDDNKELTQKYEVNSIPTLILFQNGKVTDSVISPPSEASIIDWLKKYGAL